MQLVWTTSGRAVAAFSLLAAASPVLAQGYELSELVGAPSERLGSAVASAGDLDGDGVPELLVSGQGGSGFGIVKVYLGATGSTLYTYVGAPNQSLGAVVANLGDVTGDAVPDFATSQSLGRNNRTSRVHSGATGAVHYTVNGGGAVASVGDIDGDTVPDFAVGAPAANQSVGQVTVHSGASGSPLLTVTGASPSFGGSVAGPGDVDGDGTPDLLVGAGDLLFIGGPGYAQVFSGATGSVLHTFRGSGRDQLGRSVAAMGDLDGDGSSELIVGAPQAASQLGYAQVFSGRTGALIWTVSGTGVGNSGGFGSSVAGLGDVTGDGVSDFAVGMPTAATTAWAAGRLYVFSGASGTEVARFDGVGGEWLGSSVASAGDLDRDGVPDVMTGAPYASPGGVDNGGMVKILSIPGLPFGSFAFGSGCPGSGGFEPVISTAGGAATSAGNPDFGVFLSRALGGTTALLIAGSSFQSWNGVALPLSLGSIGLPGCSLNVAADVLVPVAVSGAGPGGGAAFAPVPIPANPSLLATFVFFQWYVFDPGPLPIPAALSPGLKLLVF